MASAPLSVLVVDDSAIFRKVLKTVLGEDPRFQILGTARNGQEALEITNKKLPDAMILDVEMPVMDGLETLGKVRKQHPSVDVIMFSSLTKAGAEITFQALELGAFDFVAKPEADSITTGLSSVKTELVPKLTFLHTRKTLRNVSGGRAKPERTTIIKPADTRTPVKAPRLKKATPESESHTAKPLPTPAPKEPTVVRLAAKPLPMRRRLIAIGISTGGPKALATMMAKLPGNLDTGVLIVQHMPPIFTQTLAQRLNALSPLEVREAAEGDEVKPGLALVAPGGRHMTVIRENKRAALGTIRLNDDPPEHNCRPSVDVLFRSVAEAYGAEAVGVIMTGMGSDGTPGLREMKDKGAFVIAQSEETCTVFGMPKKPIEEGLVHEVLPLEDIADGIYQAATGIRSRS